MSLPVRTTSQDLTALAFSHRSAVGHHLPCLVIVGAQDPPHIHDIAKRDRGERQWDSCNDSPVEQLTAAHPTGTMKPPRLQHGDRVKFVSPASSPDRNGVTRGAELVAGWGLKVEIAAHAFDKKGHYLAGRDEDRLADINDALRDPGIRAVFSTCGGKGAYRIADGLDFEAAVEIPSLWWDLVRSRFCTWRAGSVAAW